MPCRTSLLTMCVMGCDTILTTATEIQYSSDLWLTMAVSVTDYTFIMFPKVKESKSSLTHAQSPSFALAPRALLPSSHRGIWGLNEKAKMVNICVKCPFIITDQRVRVCGSGSLQKVEQSQALNLNQRLKVSSSWPSFLSAGEQQITAHTRAHSHTHKVVKDTYIHTSMHIHTHRHTVVKDTHTHR